MLYWFFVKGFGWIARRRLGPTVKGLQNIPKHGGAIIAANHLAVIDDALLPITCPRMIHFMGKAEYFEARASRAGSRSGGSPPSACSRSTVPAAQVARRVEPCAEILEDGHLFGIHIEGTRSPDGRLYKGHTGVAKLALETGCPIIPVAIIGSDALQPVGTVVPKKGRTQVIYGTPIPVERKAPEDVTHDDLRLLTDRVTHAIQAMSGQEYVDEYAQTVKKRLKEQAAAVVQG